VRSVISIAGSQLQKGASSRNTDGPNHSDPLHPLPRRRCTELTMVGAYWKKHCENGAQVAFFVSPHIGIHLWGKVLKKGRNTRFCTFFRTFLLPGFLVERIRSCTFFYCALFEINSTQKYCSCFQPLRTSVGSLPRALPCAGIATRRWRFVQP